MGFFRPSWLCALLLLSGCNTVHSDKPLFGLEDVRGATPLKPGLWVLYESEEGLSGGQCRFDTQKPLRKWPECARWALVRENDLLYLVEGGRGERKWLSSTYVLVGGQPRILQTTTSFWAVDESDKEQNEYAGLAPTAHDAAGLISAYRAWDAQCGPPDHTQYPGNSGPHPSTLAPLPGLTMEESGLSCVAMDQDAVRRSVVASEAWGPDYRDVRWVRGARPDDFTRPR
jgi:hypothetical protein